MADLGREKSKVADGAVAEPLQAAISNYMSEIEGREYRCFSRAGPQARRAADVETRPPPIRKAGSAANPKAQAFKSARAAQPASGPLLSAVRGRIDPQFSNSTCYPKRAGGRSIFLKRLLVQVVPAFSKNSQAMS